MLPASLGLTRLVTSEGATEFELKRSQTGMTGGVEGRNFSACVARRSNRQEAQFISEESKVLAWGQWGFG